MENFGSIDEILDFAIAREAEAYDFYTELAAKVDKAAMKKVFEEFAQMEKGHKIRLEEFKNTGGFACTLQEIQNLKIGDYLVNVQPSGEMSYQDALILAMKKEKAAFKLYNDLSEATDDVDLKAELLCLAQEEARHKLTFEREYDDHFLEEM